MGLLEQSVLPTDDIQGDVLPGFRSSRDRFYAQHFLLLEVIDAGRARAELRNVIPRVTTAASVARPPGEATIPTSTNLAFTYEGLSRLAPGANLGRAFATHEAFRAGLAERSSSGVLVDGEPAPLALLGAPAGWTVPSEKAKVHVVVNLGARSKTALRRHVREARQWFGAGCTIVFEQPGAVIDRRQVEPFGFADGLSQPLIAGYHQPPAAGDGAGYVVPLLPAERFLVGGRDPITANGSFMVWVRFLQDRAAFDAHCAAAAAHLRRYGYRQATAAGAAALEVGRWPDGTPLTRRPIASRSRVTDPSETFDYVQDYYGRGCPRHAHVRKMNPRTNEGGEHAILRRGIPFRERGKEGLVFVCYQAAIERQYEWLQAYWANVNYEPESNASPDTMISQKARTGCTVEVPLPEGGSVPLKIRNDWIQPTGGFYAFVPSIPGLRHVLGAP
jgi:Dyp-type peroxidase family